MAQSPPLTASPRTDRPAGNSPRIPPGDAVALTRELVRIDSRNPGIAAGGPGEREVARTLASVLESWGMSVTITEVAPGRPNVVARVGSPGGRTLMFNGHLDVVGTEGMKHAPFAAEERDGRLYGRGSADMKSGVAAMCAAAVRAAGRLAGEVIVAAVADEEDRSIGTRALVESGVRAHAAIVTEPTRLVIARAHRGFAWLEVEVHGRAAHGSRYDIGVDANRLAGLLLAELDMMEETELPRRTHPLLGRASMHVPTIQGGVGMSTYADRCVLRIERRTVPGETVGDVVNEVHGACERVRARRSGFTADVRLIFAQDPCDVAVDAPIVGALRGALERAGEPVRVEGLPCWTDAAILTGAGIPAICFGPGDIALAHSAEEWVAVSEIERCTAVLTELATSWCSGGN